MNTKAGRNDPCPCGSGKKYKQCCWGKEERKAYTPAGKRRFKATLLSSSEKSSAIFGQTASKQAMPTAMPEPGSLLKFRKTTTSYEVGKVEEEKSFLLEEPVKEPTSGVEEKKSLDLPFEPTQKDFQKEDKK